MTRLLYALLLLPSLVTGIPVGVTTESNDAWASTLSDIGPLILLIGERTTKQLLRNIRGLAPAFSLATAPLGLVSVVTSLLRLAGSRRIRAFLGYELESRSVAAMELTRINCNGVHAELVDGHLVRSTTAMSDLHVNSIGVLVLQGKLEDHAEEIAFQTRSCHAFELQKINLSIPETEAALRWCLQMKIGSYDEAQVQIMVNTIASVLGDSDEIAVEDLKNVRDYWRGYFLMEQENDESLVLQPEAEGQKEDLSEEEGSSNESKANGNMTTVSQNIKNPIVEGSISFLCTFDAMSEFCTGTIASNFISTLIGVTAFLVIMILYIIELFVTYRWVPSVGYLLALIGYFGIIASIVAAALQIHYTTTDIALQTRAITDLQPWRHGIVIAAKSDDKIGAAMHYTEGEPNRRLSFEAVRLKPLSRRRRALANTIGIILTLSFLSHYMGLRSSSWWLGATELGVCILMAFIRSLNEGGPKKFISGNEQPKIDWQCCSTGVITVQDPVNTLSSVGQHALIGGMDIRIYAPYSNFSIPVSAEKLAWCLSRYCVQDGDVTRWLRDYTGMELYISKGRKSSNKRALLVCYTGGILVSEGIATPNTMIGVGFCSTIENLASPTGLLARGIMRQPSWMVKEGAFKSTKEILGNVHIPAIGSLLTWWTVSELRNGIKDNQEHLQWASLPLLTNFFMLVRLKFNEDIELEKILSAAYAGESNEVQDLAERIYQCWIKESSG